MTIEINLGRHGSRVYTGRKNGQAARKVFNIENASAAAPESYKVIVPSDTVTLNSSYLLGLFGDIVGQYSSSREFFQHFTFAAPDRFEAQIHDMARRAVFNSNNKPSLF